MLQDTLPRPQAQLQSLRAMYAIQDTTLATDGEMEVATMAARYVLCSALVAVVAQLAPARRGMARLTAEQLVLHALALPTRRLVTTARVSLVRQTAQGAAGHQQELVMQVSVQVMVTRHV